MTQLELILYGIGAIFLGFILGIIWALVIKNVEDRKIRRNFRKFLKGKKDNKIVLDDGRVLDVNKFITFDEEGNKIVIDLKGGVNIEKVKDDKEKGTNKGKLQEKPIKPLRQDSNSTGADRLRRRLRR